MFKVTFYLLSLHFILSVSEDEFTIVSTTIGPSELFLNSKSKQFIMQCTMDGKGVETLDSTNAQNKIDKRINEIEDRLKVTESKNEQNMIQHKLEVFASKTDQEVKGIHHKLDLLESNVREISQVLKIINSTLSQLTNYYNNTAYLKNCRDVQQRGHSASKIYQIKPDLSPKAFDVFCDMKQREGGWTYILNRFNGSQNFSLKWNEYKVGFGSLSGEFWLGLDNIYYLTGNEVNELLVELVDWDDKVVYAHYDAFSVGSEIEGYPLKVLGKYEGTAGDSLRFSDKVKFSTLDIDQDTYVGHCAKTYGGGWWYSACMYSLLTGKYYTENVNLVPGYTGMLWFDYRGDRYSLKQARMMVKPRQLS